jgi:hypothetical protein
MAEDGSFESIKKHGLLSTSALLNLYEIQGDERVALESCRRPESVTISKDGFPSAIVRDQKPMTESALKKCLATDVTPKQWFEILNDRRAGLSRASANRSDGRHSEPSEGAQRPY